MNAERQDKVWIDKTRLLRVISPVLFGAVILVDWAPGFAHESLPRIIEELTEEIADKGEHAYLLVARAYEYRAIRDLPSARRDLERAVFLQPASSEAHRELGRVLHLQGQVDAALREVKLAIQAANTSLERAHAHELAGDLNEARGEWEEALEASEEVLAIRPEYLEELLRRSRLQKRLGLDATRLDDLKRACRRNASIVLQVERIDALRETGHHVDCLRLIEEQMEGLRWKSTWLVRRAQLWQAMGRDDRARSDLQAAIDEITPRLRFGSPDLTLLVERGTAFAVLGNASAAAADLRLARRLGAQGWLVEDLERLLDASGASSD